MLLIVNYWVWNSCILEILNKILFLWTLALPNQVQTIILSVSHRNFRLCTLFCSEKIENNENDPMVKFKGKCWFYELLPLECIPGRVKKIRVIPFQYKLSIEVLTKICQKTSGCAAVTCGSVLSVLAGTFCTELREVA